MPLGLNTHSPSERSLPDPVSNQNFMKNVLLLSARPEIIESWLQSIQGTPVPHVEALARVFADAHASGYRFATIVADFRDADRSLIRALFQTAGFNRDQVQGTILQMDIEPGSFADQQHRFFTGLGMECRIMDGPGRSQG
jgi:hypothetical protein